MSYIRHIATNRSAPYTFSQQDTLRPTQQGVAPVSQAPGDRYESRTADRAVEEGLGRKSALEGDQARLHGGRRGASARFAPGRPHAGPSRRRKALDARQ